MEFNWETGALLGGLISLGLIIINLMLLLFKKTLNRLSKYWFLLHILRDRAMLYFCLALGLISFVVFCIMCGIKGPKLEILIPILARINGVIFGIIGMTVLFVFAGIAFQTGGYKLFSKLKPESNTTEAKFGLKRFKRIGLKR